LFLHAASKTEFTNNSLKSPKIGKLNFDILIIPQALWINEKYQRSKILCYCPFNTWYDLSKVKKSKSLFEQFWIPNRSIRTSSSR